MDFSSFIDVDLKSEKGMRQFLDLNAIAHQTIHNQLLQNGVIVPQYPLYTMGGADEDWLLVHAAEHRVWSSVLGLSTPPDLDTVDFDDQKKADDWFNNHSLHHSLVAQALGL